MLPFGQRAIRIPISKIDAALKHWKRSALPMFPALGSCGITSSFNEKDKKKHGVLG